MNIVCYKCSSVLPRRDYYIAHLKTHKLEPPFLCKQGICIYTFYDYDSLNRHLRTHHSSPINSQHCVETHIKSNSISQIDNLIEIVEPVPLNTDNAFSDQEIENLEEDYASIKDKAFKIAIGFKTRSRISQSVLNEFLTTFDDFYGEIIDLILKTVVTTHKKDINSIEGKSLSNKIESLKHPFKFINSKYLQEKELKKTGIFVVSFKIHVQLTNIYFIFISKRYVH
jgi:hypothetical protein